MKQKLCLGDSYALTKYKLKPYTIRYISLLAVLTSMCLYVRAQRPDPSGPVLSGIVIDTANRPISGATVTVKGARVKTISGRKGNFTLRAPDASGTLIISYIGHRTINKEFGIGNVGPFRLVLLPADNLLEEVVVSTGYQRIPKERATGSFVQVDNTLLNTRVTSNILERLDGVVPGLLFDKREPTAKLHIRGINTLSPAMTGPLIIVDNFPYEGSLDNINPDDVESVSILKDAAAASIWGARAANGVIVINLKRPALSERIILDFSANSSITEKANLFYQPIIASSDFIDIEKMLFEKGFYDNVYNHPLNQGYVFSPVVRVLFANQQGEISSDSVDRAISTMRGLDYRTDMARHIYRRGAMQQYTLSASGGGGIAAFAVSAGLVRERGGMVGTASDRFTLRAANTFRPFRKLTIQSNVVYSSNGNRQSAGGASYPINPGGRKGSLYPYARLVDEAGSALAIPYNYNDAFIDTAGKGLLLDWRFKPVEDIRQSRNENNTRHFNIALNADYELLPWMMAKMQYGFEGQRNDMRRHYGVNSFYARDLVNRFTQIDGNNVLYTIPKGGILDLGKENMTSHRVRGQLNVNKDFLANHNVSAFIGSELSSRSMSSSSHRTYGYDDDILTFQQVDYVNPYPIFGGIARDSRVPTYGGFGGSLRRFVSFYGNGAYQYKQRYIATFSARKDASNLFGVRTNHRWNPLWSAGLAWIASNEGFLRENKFINRLKVRATYGHSGNTAGGASASTIITHLPNAQYTGIPYALVTRLPNLSLRWENVRMLNTAVDFSLLGHRITGSFEYFTKISSDLITSNPIDPTTGFNAVLRNVGEVKGQGVDIQLNARVTNGNVKWESSASFSYVSDIVTKFYGNTLTTNRYVSNTGQTLTSLQDKAFYPVFSYRFAGLDPDNGDPIGYYEGQHSKDYSLMMRDSLHRLNYHGSGLPPYHGFLRNTISWKNIDLSFNITYKFGHYFQRETVSYSALFNSWFSHADYYKRWQAPGDEKHTSIPSMVYPADANRDNFYALSEANIERGDHVRLSDIRVAYAWETSMHDRKIRFDIFLTSANVALLWTKTKTGLDPEYSDMPAPRTYSFGIKGRF